jgi:SAM-dependent methyltransferase
MTSQHTSHTVGGARQHAHAASAGSPDDAMTVLLDLDGEVLLDYWSAALDWAASAAGALAAARTARVLDLGAGTGTGALGLADRFPRAEVIALDVEAGSLARVRHQARERGLDGRVRVLEHDLDTGWPDLGSLDLTWASMSLHHMADPGRVLGDVLRATRPGGLIAVAEFAEQLRFLPSGGGPGAPGFLEDRIADVLGRAHAEQLPTLGSAWAPRLADAGWEVAGERAFAIDLDPPAHPRAAEYARSWFARLSQGLTDRLDPDVRATLAELLTDPSVLAGQRLHIRGTRTVTLGRRPAS